MLGNRFNFAFVVLNSDNDYGAPFFVLLTLDQVEARTRTQRIQYQVNFRSDSPADGEVIVLRDSLNEEV